MFTTSFTLLRVLHISAILTEHWYILTALLRKNGPSRAQTRRSVTVLKKKRYWHIFVHQSDFNTNTHGSVSARSAIHNALCSVYTSGKTRACSSFWLGCCDRMLLKLSGFPGSNLLWNQTALTGRIWFFSSLDYSRQILQHSFKNGTCPLSSTSLPIYRSITKATARQTHTNTDEIKVPIRIAACTYCHAVSENTQVCTELLQHKLL